MVMIESLGWCGVERVRIRRLNERLETLKATATSGGGALVGGMGGLKVEEESLPR